MSDSQPYELRENDRLAVVGKTGSGKTAAVKNLVLDGVPNWLFLDVKGGESDGLGVPVLEEIGQVKNALFAEDPDERLSRFAFRPQRPDLDTLDQVCQLCYERKGIHLVADELKTLYHGSSLTKHHNLIMTNGRSRGVGMTATTQRPKRIPIESLSEAEHLFGFKLKIGDDRDRMAQIVGKKHADVLRKIRPYQYLYDHDRLEEPQVCEPLDI